MLYCKMSMDLKGGKTIVFLLLDVEFEAQNNYLRRIWL